MYRNMSHQTSSQSLSGLLNTDPSNPMILNLRGLTREYVESVDDIFESKFTETLQDDDVMVKYEVKETTLYRTPPEYFTNISEWPHNSDLDCSYCSLIISEIPFPEIEKISMIEPFKAQTVKRYFCDALCCRSFLDREYTGQKLHDKVKFMKLIYDKCLRYECAAQIMDEKNKEKTATTLSMSKIVNIPQAPDKTMMKKFSGDKGITPDEYRELKEHIKRENKLGKYGW